MGDTPWSPEIWRASTSVRGYNVDWFDTLTPEAEPKLWSELKSIFEEEVALGEIPGWAVEIVSRMMELPMCGYYAYPANVQQILDAIESHECPDIVMRCYTVDPDRKVLLSYYVFCLDAWYKQAPPETAVAELSRRNQLGKDWDTIAHSIFRTLGKRTEIKEICVERLIHRLRWWIKSLVWADDRRDRFQLDVYSGDIRGDEVNWSAYGNSPYGDPYFTELGLPRVKAMEDRIRQDVPDGEGLVERMRGTWLCAPKVFRYVEKIISEIGAIGSGDPPSDPPPILQCEDTYPDFVANGRHFTALVDRLRRWLDGDAEQLPSLRASSPVERWLIHLLWHKLVFHARYEGNFAKLVGQRPGGRSGTRRPLA